MELTRSAPILAAVVICRNEERWIETSLRSVLEAVEPFPGAEVVVVDSCSTDRTVERARALPVKVVELRATAPLSAALGRLVGERLTRSRYLLFVDGDTEVRLDWVREALDYLERNPRVAGVAGKLHEIYFRGERRVGENPDCFGVGPEPEEVDQLGGNAIYRRAALEAVGSFNPYVVSYEEAELAERLRRAEGVVVRLPIVLGTHRTGQWGTFAELRRRRRENLIKGYGQTLRLGLSNGTFPAHAHRMARYLQFIAGCALGALAGLTSLLTGDWRFVGAWLLGVAVFVLVFMWKTRSVTKPLRLLLDWAVWAGPMIVGFLERPRGPGALALQNVVAAMHEPVPPTDAAVRRQGAGRC